MGRARLSGTAFHLWQHPSSTQINPKWAAGKGGRHSGLILEAGPAERDFNRIISKVKTEAFWLIHRVWTGFRPFSR
jgi:hypothetical protein